MIPTGRTWDGEFATVEECTTDAGDLVLVKTAKDPDFNDHLVEEALTTTVLRSDAGTERFRPYFPELLQSKDNEAGLRVNVFAGLEGWYSLTDVIAEYPDGVDPKDFAWMWRRILVALGVLYEQGMSHGAVVPDHVLIHPTEHGLVLWDWCYASYKLQPMRVTPMTNAHWYNRSHTLAASTDLDLGLAVRTAVQVLGGEADASGRVVPATPPSVPKEFRAHFRGALQSGVHPWKVQKDFDELLERLYGPRRYRPFTMPAVK